jgi:hypothetical protein
VLHDRDAPTVADLCRSLDGIALAMAAAGAEAGELPARADEVRLTERVLPPNEARRRSTMESRMDNVATAGAVVVDYVGAMGPEARHVRGALVASSLQTLKDSGHYGAYLDRLPKQHHDALLFCLASSWLPLDLAAVHYHACDALELDEREMMRIGEVVSHRIMGTFLGTMLRSARSLGATPTPWVVLKSYHKVCERLLDGGHHRVMQQGPKDALIETSGLPLFRYRYFRTAMVGMCRGAASIFARSCFSKELSAGPDRARVSLRWV